MAWGESQTRVSLTIQICCENYKSGEIWRSLDSISAPTTAVRKPLDRGIASLQRFDTAPGEPENLPGRRRNHAPLVTSASEGALLIQHGLDSQHKRGQAPRTEAFCSQDQTRICSRRYLSTDPSLAGLIRSQRTSSGLPPMHLMRLRTDGWS